VKAVLSFDELPTRRHHTCGFVKRDTSAE
jgi:hypothetical protein